MDIDILGIDLAKRVFQLHGSDRRGKALHSAKVLSAELISVVRRLQTRIIAMEAYRSAHYWGRQFQTMRQMASVRFATMLETVVLLDRGGVGQVERIASSHQSSH